MSGTDEITKTAINPLDDLDLNIKDLGANGSTSFTLPKSDTVRVHNDEILDKLKSDDKFVSREPVRSKPKHIAKSVSLFPVELQIISDSYAEYMQFGNIGNGKPSDSDIIRAALHIFKSASTEERASAIYEHHGRRKK